MSRRRRRNPDDGKQTGFPWNTKRKSAWTRKDFTEEQWDELDEEAQEEIYSKGVDKKRAAAVAHLMDRSYAHVSDASSYDLSSEEEVFEYWLSERHTSISDYVDLDEYVSTLREEGYGEDVATEAVEEALVQQNNWDVDIDGDNDHIFEQELRGSLYLEPDALSYYDTEAFDVFYESDIPAAMAILNEGTYEEGQAADAFEYHVEELWEILDMYGRPWDESKEKDTGFGRRRSRYPTVEIDDLDSEMYLVADPIEEDVLEYAREFMGDPEEEEAEEREEKVIMRLTAPKGTAYKELEGFTVLDMSPEGLRRLGRKEDICVGDNHNYGYADNVRNGSIKILVLKDPDGNVMFTIEVVMDGQTPTKVKQIKAAHNVFPGFGRGQRSGKVKAKRLQEVALAKMVVENLGLDPMMVRDLEPALTSISTAKRNPGGRRRFYGPAKTFSDPAG